VVASAFTTRAVFYRRTKGYSEQDVMMSVLVLTMIESKASGVMYTVDPNSACNDDLLLAAAWGLGVSVVDGSIGRGFLAHQAWGQKNSASRNRQQGIPVRAAVPGRHRFTARCGGPPQQACLTPEQVSTLTDYALRLEAHYGMPLDIEWALDDNDDLFILQARPLQRAGGLERADCCELVQGHTPILFGGQAASLGVASGKVHVPTPTTN
jgi:pyruvate, water dikinase